MTAAADRLSLTVAGKVHEGWTEVRLTRGIERLAADLTLAVTERRRAVGKPWVIRPGDACEVRIGGDLVITGWVDTYAPSLDATGHRVEIAVRSRTADLADCAAIVPGGRLAGLDLVQLARTLAAPFGLDAECDTDAGAPFRVVQVEQGETVFDLLERHARLRGVLLTDTPEGHVRITRAGSTKAGDALVQGANILKAGAEIGQAERFSAYIVLAQQQGVAGAAGTAAAGVRGEVRDKGIRRHRPRVIVAEGQADPATARRRAEWDMARRRGRGSKATITVAGWRQSGGSLWQANQRVAITAPWLSLDEATEFVIGEITYTLDEGGSLAELTCMPPEAFTPEPPAEAADEPAAGTTAAATGRSGLWADVMAVR